MQSKVILTNAKIEELLRDLPLPWSISSDHPAGSARSRQGLEGPAGAWLDFYGIVRATEPVISDLGDPKPVGGNLPNTAPGVSDVRDTDPSTPVDPTRAPHERPIAQEHGIVAIEYEAHPEMAQHQLELLVERIGTEHGLLAMLVIHRIGHVPVAEASLLVRILSGHRGESLRACAEFIDELKKWVPIWKHPIYA